MKRLIAAVLALSPMVAFAGEPIVVLINGTQTDVSVEVRVDEPQVELLPNERKPVSVRQLRWLRFGQEAQQYNVKSIKVLAARSTSPLVLQAHSDGRLYVVPSGSTAPVATFPPQPPGFPVRPSKKVDLT